MKFNKFEIVKSALGSMDRNLTLYSQPPIYGGFEFLSDFPWKINDYGLILEIYNNSFIKILNQRGHIGWVYRNWIKKI